MESGSRPSRRAVLVAPCAAGAAAALGACSTYGGSAPDPTQAPPPSPTGEAPGGPPTGGATGGAPPAEPPLARLGDIPVGGGKIFGDQKVVVTQPQAGTVKAFSTACTHQGCEVTTVEDGTINCPCHGSRFAIADGSVDGGPAPRPLSPVAVTVTGDAITLA
ncbi:Rieske (2Fe-2S) protein [Actinomycetes bacterium KLBMP 9797]